MGRRRGNFVEIDPESGLSAYVRYREPAHKGDGFAVYEHFVDAEGNTIAFDQIVFNEAGEPIIWHQKYPVDREISLIRNPWKPGRVEQK